MSKVVPRKPFYQFRIIHNFWRTGRCHFLFLHSGILNWFWTILEISKMETGLLVSGLWCPLACARTGMTRVIAYMSHRCHCGRLPSSLEGADSRYRLNFVELLQLGPIPVPFHAKRELTYVPLLCSPSMLAPPIAAKIAVGKPFARDKRTPPVSRSPEPSGCRCEQGPTTRSASITRISGRVRRHHIATGEELYHALTSTLPFVQDSVKYPKEGE
jgi:hypothetical protein